MSIYKLAIIIAIINISITKILWDPMLGENGETEIK